MYSAESKPIIHNAGAFHLQPRSISVIMIQTPTALDTQHIYQLDTSDNLPLGLIPLAVDHKINHKYPKSLSIPILNTAYDTVWISRATVISTLNPVEIKSSKVSSMSWTTTEKLQDSTRNSLTILQIIPLE